MSDPPLHPGSTGDTRDDTGTPRWVYVFGTVVIVLIVLFVILHLAGGGMGGHTS